MRAEGFSLSLDINKLQFLTEKNITKKTAVFFFSSVIGHQKTGSGLDPDRDSHEVLDPDPHLMNPDPQLCGLEPYTVT